MDNYRGNGSPAVAHTLIFEALASSAGLKKAKDPRILTSLLGVMQLADDFAQFLGSAKEVGRVDEGAALQFRVFRGLLVLAPLFDLP